MPPWRTSAFFGCGGAAPRALGLVAVAILGAAAAACRDGPATPYALPDGAPVVLAVTVSEEIRGTPLARRFEMTLRGTARGGTLRLVLTQLAYERGGPDGTRRLDPQVAAEPAERAAEDAPLLRVLDCLRGRDVHLRLHPADGLAAVEGLDAALAVAAPAGDAAAADARDGLRSIAGDAALARTLRAAGLAPVPSAARRKEGEAVRVAQVRIPGRGVAAMRLVGRAGMETDGSPVLPLAGAPTGREEFEPDLAAPPPDDVGAVLLEGVRAEATTLYDPHDLRPLRGRFELTVPHAGGLTVVTGTSFQWFVR